jgi:fucose 4-O-acetylase-like acetyltransferase
MKTPRHIAVTALFFLATAPALRADFLRLQINESTAKHVWHWGAAFTALLVLVTMTNSRSKGGQGR